MIIPSLFTESFLWPPSDLTDIIFWRTSISIFLNLSSSKLISWSFLIDLFIFAFNCLQRFFVYLFLYSMHVLNHILLFTECFLFIYVSIVYLSSIHFLYRHISALNSLFVHFIFSFIHGLFIDYFFELFVWTSPDLTARMFWWTIYHSESLWFQNNLCFSIFIQCMSWIICLLFTDYF